MAATVLSLMFGILLMAKGGGEENGAKQNKMMTYRIYFQAAAILVMIAAFSLSK